MPPVPASSASTRTRISDPTYTGTSKGDIHRFFRSSCIPFVRRVDDPRAQPGNFFKINLEYRTIFRLNQPAPLGEFKKGNAFLHRFAGDAEEILPVADGESAVAFGDVGGSPDLGLTVNVLDALRAF